MTKRTIRFLSAACLAALAAFASNRVLEAQLPQAVGTWRAQGSIADPRSGAASVTIGDGRTLILGGQRADGSATDSVIVYDPLANGVSSAGQLFAPRMNAAAARLDDGRVVVSGGQVGGAPSADVEIFDPTTGTSTFAATMAAPRAWHASTRLADGRVLIVGGATTDGTALATAEIFDPQTSAVAPAGTMTTARMGLSATTTIEGRVLVAGGNTGTENLATAEIYDAASSTFLPVPTTLSQPRAGHTALLLPHNGGVLIAGGTAAGTSVTTVDLFLPAIFPDPYTWGMGSFAATGAMNAARSFAVSGPAGDEGFAYAAGGGSADVEAYRFATIKTDKNDYAPGERAVISGSGWQPNERVTLTFQEDPAVHDDYSLAVEADAQGNIYWDQWAPEYHDFGVRFYLTAEGQRSRAQVTFTDGGFLLLAGPGSTFTASYFIYPGTTNSCATVPPPANTISQTSVSVTSTSGPTVALANNQFGKFVVPVVSNEGAAYVSALVTGNAAAIISNTVNAAGTHREICFQSKNNSSTNVATLTISYATAATSTTVQPATAIYGDSSVTLSATVSSGSPVNVGTVTFTVKQGTNIIGTATQSNQVADGAASVSYTLPARQVQGTYTIETSYSGGTGVASSSGSGSLTINRKPVTVATQNANKIYGAADPTPLTTADLAGFLSGDTITATFARDPGGDVASYHITTTLVDPNNRLGNYVVTNTGATFIINQKPVTVVTQPASKTYGAADPDPLTSANLTVFLAADTITATFAREPGDDVATYHITTTLVDPNHRLANYVVTNDGAGFTIDRKPVTVVTQPASKTYGAADPNPLTSANLTVFLAADTITATFTREPGDDVATYHITTTLVDPNNRLANYIVTNDGASFTIDRKPVTVVTLPASKTYGAADPDPLTSASLTVFLATDSITATFAREPGDDVATYHITTTLVDPNHRLANYVVTNDGASFTIDRKAVTVITQPASKTYGNDDPNPLTSANLTVFLTADSIAATFTREPGDDVATYHITTTLVDPDHRLANYVVTNDGASFTIDRKTVTVITQPASKTYGNDDPDPLTSANLTVFLAADTITATFARNPGNDAGDFHITTTLVDPNNRLANYSVTNTGATFTINRKAVDVVTHPASKTYGDDDPTPLTSANLTVFLAADTITATFARDPGNDAGDFHITTTLVDPNHRLGNYAVTNLGATFTIHRRLLTVTATGVDKFYDGTTDATVNLTHDALVGDDVTAHYVSASFANKNVGENLAISVSDISLGGEDAANYTLNGVTTATADADIKPRPASVTPDAAGKTYGNPEPTLTGSLSGFVTTDGISATYSRTLGETVAGSPYTITATLSPTGALSNYDITYNTALFTISRRQASVTPNPAHKVYGDLEPSLSGSLSGFLTADGITAAYSRASGETVAGSPYTISATLSPAGVLGNYDVTYNTAPFNIYRKPVTVVTQNASKIYGEADPNPLTTADLSGFLAADGITATISRASGSSVGPYHVTTALVDPNNRLGNYSVTNIGSTFTIDKRPASVTPNPASKAFGAADPTLTGTLTGFVPGDNVTATYTRPLGEAVGTYTITATLGPAGVLGNYDIDYKTAVFTISAWSLSGFYQPVGIPNTVATPPGRELPAPLYPVWNAIKGGQTVPLKFELFAVAGGTELTSVGDVQGFVVSAMPCTAGPEDWVETEFTTTSSTMLRYSDGQFIQNWDSPKGAGKCYRVTMTARDGSHLSAFFKAK